jgi:hypothetical protein
MRRRFALISGVFLTLLVVICCRDRQEDGSRQVADISPSGVADPALADSANARDSSPAGIVRKYYDAIQSGDYTGAYSLWYDGGKASRQTLDAFTAGFAKTAEVRAIVSDSVTVRGAAGSQYATVPVVVRAVTRNGEKQVFTGTYTMRRAMVDGATPEQRRWHIYSAVLRARRASN